MSKIYGAQRSKVIEFIESKGGAEVTTNDLRAEFPELKTTGFTTLLSKMVNEGDIARKYRGVYVSASSFSAANTTG